MARLDRNDHKAMDIGAKIVKGIGITAASVAAIAAGAFLKSSISPDDEDDDDEDDD